MGCDEHFYLEIKRGRHWYPYYKPVPNKYYDPEQDHPSKALELPQFKMLTGGRNYHAYAVLAGVRNGSYADSDKGVFVPISKPKGLPRDVSPEVRAVSDRWGVDGHSHTYLTLQELRDYPWWRRVELAGWLHFTEYARWASYGKERDRTPESYSGGVHGQGIVHITMEAADRIFKAQTSSEEAAKQFWAWVRSPENRTPFPMAASSITATVRAEDRLHERERLEKWLGLPAKTMVATDEQVPLDRLYALCTWSQLYTEAVGDLWTRGIPTMMGIAKDEGVTLKELRVVGFFDN